MCKKFLHIVDFYLCVFTAHYIGIAISLYVSNYYITVLYLVLQINFLCDLTCYFVFCLCRTIFIETVLSLWESSNSYSWSLSREMYHIWVSCFAWKMSLFSLPHLENMSSIPSIFFSTLACQYIYKAITVSSIYVLTIHCQSPQPLLEE